MGKITEKLYGKLTLTNILASIWLGDWDTYENALTEIPDNLKDQFPFHSYYRREQIELWYENHFYIPGNYFVSPYFSSYLASEKDEESRRQDLLCLIGIYEKVGFYYPLEKELYPDHLGCLTLFLNSIVNEQLTALANDDTEYYNQLLKLETQIHSLYITPVIKGIIEEANKKISHKFFKEFLNFYKIVMVEEWSEVSS